MKKPSFHSNRTFQICLIIYEMSFHSNSTQSSHENWIELSTLPQCSERSNSVFSADESTLDVASQAFFMEYFPDFQNSPVEYFSFDGYAPDTKLDTRIRSFRYKQNMYALFGQNLARAVILETIQKAESEGIELLYLTLDSKSKNFISWFKMLGCVGFKQVKPKVQKYICTAPGVVILYLKVN